jgi:hypothetical protein
VGPLGPFGRAGDRFAISDLSGRDILVPHSALK